MEDTAGQLQDPTSGRRGKDPAPLRAILSELERVRRGARRRLLLSAMGAVLAVYVLGGTLVGVADFFLRLPTWLRGGFWGLGFAILVVAVRMLVLPAWKFRPSLSDIALRLERAPGAREAGLPGVLASGLDLAARDEPDSLTRALGQQVSIDAAHRLGSVNARRTVLINGPAGRALAWLVLVAIPPLVLAWAKPSLTFIGARRVLTPWTSAAWPKRTGVVDATRLAAHPLGTALPLRALVTRTPKLPGQTDVEVFYRLVDDGSPGPERSMLLTSQGSRSGVESGVGEPGELYERLFEASVLVPPGASPANLVLEYRFQTEDDATAPRRVRLVEPPAMRSALASIEPPEYAKPFLGEGGLFVRGERDMGNGLDSRSAVGPVLLGSKVTLALDLNKALVTPREDDAPALAAFLAGAFKGLEGVADLRPKFTPQRWSIQWTLAQPARVAIDLKDEYGIHAADQAAFRFEGVEDRPPTASIIEPAADESLLPSAVVDVVGEGRDDVGLAWVEMRGQKARRPADSVGAAPQGVSEPAPLARVEGASLHDVGRAAATLQLPTLDLRPGDEVWLTTAVLDAYLSEGKHRDPVLSGVRRLRIIGESELVEQVRGELGTLREAVARLEREQRKLNESRASAVRDAAEAARQAGAQSGVRERLGPIDDSVRRLSRRLERNRLDDPALRGMLQDAGEALQDASSASEQASQALERMGTQDDAQRKVEEPALRKAQDRAQAALSELAAMLDTGQDSWAVRRDLEKLLGEQKQLMDQTRAAGQDVQGRRPEELTQHQREDIERLSNRQKELAQRSAAAVESLRDRGAKLRKDDPGQSQAMGQAAARAQQQQLENQQRDAANRLQENKSSQAEELQAQAAKTIEQMLQDLQQVQQKRDDALRRTLAEISESLRRLIGAQERELAALGAAIPNGSDALQGLDAGMIALQRDTLAVRDRVDQEMREGEHLLDLLSAAGDAQGDAIVALRQSPPDASEGDEGERTSLSRLRDALAEAEKLDAQAGQRDDARRRGQLLKAYREGLEAQSTLLQETRALSGHELTRRERAQARAMGERQESLRRAMEKLCQETKELADAKVFGFAHARLAGAMSRAGKALSEGDAGPSVARDEQASVAVLHSLVESLEDAQKQDEFRQAQGGGSGGGASGGRKPQLLPTLAQLKLLRGMQGEAAARTREVGDSPKGEGLEDVAGLQAELSRLGKELVEELNAGEGEPALPEPPKGATP